VLLRVTPSSPLSIAAGAPVIKKLANVAGGGPAAKRVYKEALLPRSQRAAASRGGQKLSDRNVEMRLARQRMRCREEWVYEASGAAKRRGAPAWPTAHGGQIWDGSGWLEREA
jgi:hypothetical protein